MVSKPAVGLAQQQRERNALLQGPGTGENLPARLYASRNCPGVSVRLGSIDAARAAARIMPAGGAIIHSRTFLSSIRVDGWRTDRLARSRPRGSICRYYHHYGSLYYSSLSRS
jgi:hypothetical protein